MDGTSYSFKNYLEKFVPDEIRKKVQALSKTPQKGAGAFSNKPISQKGSKKMEEENVVTPEIRDAAGLKAAYPEMCAQIAEEAVKNERERLKAIDGIAQGIPADVLEKAKYTEPVTAAELALAQMKANNSAGRKFMDDLEKDLETSGAAAVGGNLNSGYDPEGEQRAQSTEKVSALAAALGKDKRRGKK